MKSKFGTLSIGVFIFGMALEAQTASILIADPASPFDLGIVRNNSIGSDFGITLSNIGDSNTTALSCGWSGTSFTDSSCDGAIVSQGGMIAITISATPTTTGMLTDTLQINYGVDTLDLSVSVMVPELWIEPNSYTFADTVVGNSDGPKTFTVTNDDSTGHTIHSLNMSGDSGSFSMTGAGISSLGPGDSTNFDVTFMPTTTGLLSSNITLLSDGSVPMTVTVEGTGVVPIPAAVWLFSSGLIGLVGLARRKKV